MTIFVFFCKGFIVIVVLLFVGILVMLTTIEQLDAYVDWSSKSSKSTGIRKEIKIFWCILLSMTLIVTVFTNWTLFVYSFQSLWSDVPTIETVQQEHTFAATSQIHPSWSPSNNQNQHAQVASSQDIEKQKVDKLIDTYNPLLDQDEAAETTYKNTLKQKLDTYALGFNTLAPTNRLIIPSQWKNVPIIMTNFEKDIKDIHQWDFDKELEKWVVRYPTTALPWTKWNTLLFGHTSYDERKDNTYGTVFAWLPKLEAGEIIQIVWDWQLYTYRVKEKKVVRPRDVNDTYLAYNDPDTHLLTLMWCYPLGTTDKRILVIAELVE